MANGVGGDLKAEFVALMERAEAASLKVGDTLGALEASLGRVLTESALSEVEERIASGASPTILFEALARAFGFALVAAVVALTKSGKAEHGVGVIVPALGDIAKAIAKIQDERATEQGKLFS